MVKKQSKKSIALIILVFGVTLCAILALGWMVIKEVSLHSTKNVYESKSTIVINTVGAPKELVNTMLAESGCDGITPSGKNINYIVREESGVALVQYGCGLDAHMFYKKTDGTWNGINPTNQFLNGTPLCSHLKEHAIPASFQAYCYESFIRDDGKQPELVSSPVN